MHISCFYRPRFRLLLAGWITATSLCLHADLVLDWNNALLRAARAARLNPPVFSRAAAIVHLSIADAANGVVRWHHPYLVQDLAPANTSWDAAVTASAFTSAMAVITHADTQRTNFTALYEASLAAIPDGEAKTRGIAWGETVARSILNLRASDGSTTAVSYTNAPAPGVWRPTPPANAAALLPGWGQITRFSWPASQRLIPHQPPGLETSAYALEYDIVRRLGGKTGSERTADQTEIALFWADGAGTETPPGHWNHIAQDVAAERGNNAQANARLFALLNISLADAAITCWDAKYAYNLWRPITAIREADSDSNPGTVQDPTWEPLIVTPPFPEYTSGHATFSRAAACTLANVFGSDAIAFQARSEDLPGVVRSYKSFSAAADESGVSRIYGGIHWHSANIAGQTLGFRLGTHVTSYFLAPLTAAHFARIQRSGETTDITLTVEPNRTYQIQVSSDLETWTSLGTVHSPTSTASFRDTATQSDRLRFYRALAQ